MIYVEFISPSSLNWEIFGDRIYAIEQSVFGEKSLDKEMMKSDINDPDVFLVILKDDTSIVGFTYALPENDEEVRIVDTVLLKEYQNKGLVSQLMCCLEAGIRKNSYKYITRDAMVENGYADKITKNYSSQIVESREFVGEWGKQKYFKIRL